MKKVFFSTFVACVLFCSSMANALYHSFIYITNKTGEILTTEPVEKETGQRVLPAFKTRLGKGSYKKLKLEGYSCKVSNALAIPPTWKCSLSGRKKVPSEVKRSVVSEKQIRIKPNETVKIAKIDRDHLSSKKVKWWDLLSDVKNPDSKKFRKVKSRVYPYELLATGVRGPSGYINFRFLSERIGMSRAFATSMKFVIAGFAGIGATAAVLANLGSFVMMPVGGAAGGLFFAGLATLALAPTLIGVDQKSGLLTVPLIDGGYEISYKTKLRFGNVYKDLYITIKPK